MRRSHSFTSQSEGRDGSLYQSLSNSADSTYHKEPVSGDERNGLVNDTQEVRRTVLAKWNVILMDIVSALATLALLVFVSYIATLDGWTIDGQYDSYQNALTIVREPLLPTSLALKGANAVRRLRLSFPWSSRPS